MNRAEHLAWAKERAMEHVNRGEIQDALASMASDCNKHPELQGHPGNTLGFMLLATGNMDQRQARHHIEGYN